jgi:5-oxoprolinase (ATP-hydrolysing)
VVVHHAARPESGGGGARCGGDGVVARYEFAAPMRVRVALDRITNPPHGLDRAGPPLCSELTRIDRLGASHRIAPWQTHSLGAGEAIEVRTAGGAGHGFPGWGIEFEWE